MPGKFEEIEVVKRFGSGIEYCGPRTLEDADFIDKAFDECPLRTRIDVTERRPCEAVEGHDHVTIDFCDTWWDPEYGKEVRDVV